VGGGEWEERALRVGRLFNPYPNPNPNHLPEWIAYNHVQGMEHWYVYGNDDFAKAEAALRPFVDAGLATLVDWTPPAQHANSFLYQQAQQNSCLLRARGRVHWVALHDSDEFFYAAKPWTSVAQMLHKFVHDGVDDQIGTVQARTWFYGMHDAEPEQKERQGAVDVGSANLPLARCVAHDKGPIYAGREKLIVRPEHVHYVSVHSFVRPDSAFTRDLRAWGVAVGGGKRVMEGDGVGRRRAAAA